MATGNTAAAGERGCGVRGGGTPPVVAAAASGGGSHWWPGVGDTGYGGDVLVLAAGAVS